MSAHSAAPQVVQRTGRRAGVALGRASSRLRVAPSFLVVGAQRAGTTSLFRALMAHPHVLRPLMHKGVNYFDVNYHRDWSWYLGHFPLRATAQRRRPPSGSTAAVFEASGYYMFHPHAAGRIAERLPDVRVVAMVRDPVERAYSAYKHELARGFETETFERALELEDARVAPELARMLADPGYQSAAYRHQAYRRRGHYAEQLQRFVDKLGREHVHVVESERFFGDPAGEFTRLLDFLELPRLLPASFDQFNARPGMPLTPPVEADLRNYFQPHDAALAKLLGRPPLWSR
jgi:hypothetical protein